MPKNQQNERLPRYQGTFWQKAQRAASLTLVFLLIEFFDELHYGIHGAVLPSIRTSLGLNYNQIGLLLGLPHLVNIAIEPVLMMLGDTNWRRNLIATGGVAVSLSLFLFANAHSFTILLLASILVFTASGSFVSLSQASLIDRHPSREAQMMARWTVFGSFGSLLGPLVVAGGLAYSLGWRWLFAGLCILAAGLTLLFWVYTSQRADNMDAVRLEKTYTDLGALAGKLWSALRQRELLRWTALLLAADLLLDTFSGYLALYLTDTAGFTEAQASLAYGVCMLASLAADLGLLPLLERYNGRQIVRASAFLAIALYPIWLLASPGWAKIVLLVAVRLATIGWYPVLMSEAFRSLNGQSGAVLAIESLAGLAGGGLTWVVGAVAGHAGLGIAMWLLLAGPICLVFGVPAPQTKVEAKAIDR
jgi:MFS transporter, FSR family, fosmidomycin resistance protein